VTDLLELSARLIETGDCTTPSNRITNTLSEVADGLAVVESFSHSWALGTGDGLVVLDASGALTAAGVVAALRGWRTDPVHTLVYTHGHVDHVGGSGALLADNRERGHRDPEVIGHANIPARFDRYDLTNDFNLAINIRQFAPGRRLEGFGLGDGQPSRRFLPADTARCTTVYDESMSTRVGDVVLQLHHGRGETDDHTWIWEPQRRAAFVGDFVTWVFPNAGNPQKVQRYPSEWAQTLRRIAALEPELLLPAHGLPVAGRARIATLLDDIARALETIVDEVLAMMNDGRALDEIVHTVRVPDELIGLPYMQPIYDEPEFVVRNVWRQYGGWWDGNAARLKPPLDGALATEVAALGGGAGRLAERARQLAEGGDLRLACQLVEWAATVDPDGPRVRDAHTAVYTARRKSERSLMAKGIFGEAADRFAD
jgi:alkyl sulfatase BDS1-like metallo-beta-lactamase superfamily hydrolase